MNTNAIVTAVVASNRSARICDCPVELDGPCPVTSKATPRKPTITPVAFKGLKRSWCLIQAIKGIINAAVPIIKAASEPVAKTCPSNCST